MNKTTGWMVTGITLLAGVVSPSATAAAPASSTATLIAAVSLGQTKEIIPQDRRAVAAVLKQTRAAIKRGDFDQANALLTRAEKSNVKYPPLVYLGATPKKVRAELEKARSIAGPSLPSSKFRPGGNPSAPIAKGDPLLVRESGAEASFPTRTGASALQHRQLLPGADANKRRASDAALLKARRALAQGDIQQAEISLAVAQRLKVAYHLREDSPAKAAAAIGRHKQVMANRQDTMAWRQQRAMALVEQAQALIFWKDFAEAERLATDALQLGPDLGQYDTSPRDLLGQIASLRARSSRGVPTPDTGAALTTSDPSNRLTQPASVAPAAVESVSPPARAAGNKSQALTLLAAARDALQQMDVDRADQLCQEAISLNVPDALYEEGDDTPWRLANAIQQARTTRIGVVPAVAMQSQPAADARHALYNPAADPTSNVPASSNVVPNQDAYVLPAQYNEDVSSTPTIDVIQPPVDLQPPITEDALPTPIHGAEANVGPAAPTGEAPALQQPPSQSPGNLGQPEPVRVAPGMLPNSSSASNPNSLLQGADDAQRVLSRKLAADYARAQSEVRRIREQHPRRALQMLVELHQTVVDSPLSGEARERMIQRVDLAVGELEQYIEDNRHQIALDDQNRGVLDDVERRRNHKLKIQQEIASLVNEFNQLVDEQRYHEAERVAKKLRALAPDEPIAQQVWTYALFIRRNHLNRKLADDKERGFVDVLRDVEEAAIPFDSNNPYQLPNRKKWEDMSNTRRKGLQDRNQHMTAGELEIQRKLTTPVMVNFHNTPLSEVIDHLQKLTGINIHLDEMGLSHEGVLSDTPITLDLKDEIQLKSALNIILERHHLSYVIKDEVLQITSHELRQGKVYTHTYYVADLVIPIPNFSAGSQMGMQGAINAAMQSVYGAQGGLGFASNGPVVGALGSANNRRAGNRGLESGVAGAGGVVPAGMMANVPGGPPRSGSPGAMFGGPGGMGGGVEPDFDQIIDLIEGTIAPDTWESLGGPGSIREYYNNLSIIISQTQEVHEQIADLLDQLRRLQDLQVTIEVRFIQVNDRFFERIGIDFDFDIKAGETRTITQLNAGDKVSPSATVGLDPTGAFTADLDIPFTQNSFSQSVPTFGGFDPASAAGFGFAILSDIEAFFVIQAAQGDSRTNVLQAPKVTLFNGQQALVADIVQRPFVVSVVPVVGDFAAAQQPVIVVLSEGTFMTIQAVVSDDRRYVRMTVVPTFSQIGDVQTFTFDGTSSSSSSSSGTDDDDDDSSSNDESESRSGTTVQQPVLSTVTVTTTVSVPDGGTVLLGGIKRLSEGRNEFGVPMLSKIPYVNRLFRNIGVGKETQSLMMMVTPRIIIQEEEEERLGITP